MPAFMAAQEKLYPAVEKAVLDSVVRACKAVDGCAGLKKLEECVSALELSQHFDVNVKPLSLPRDQDVLAYLGATKAGYQTAAQLIGGWRSYVASWEKPAAQLSPAAVCKFWRTHADGANASLSELGKLAIKEFSRPISSACCERIFSYLTHMDSSDRQTMGKDLLATLAFPARQLAPGAHHGGGGEARKCGAESGRERARQAPARRCWRRAGQSCACCGCSGRC